MKLSKWMKMLSVSIMISGLSGCFALQLGLAVVSTTNTYLLYQIKNMEVINVTTISKECYLYEIICLDPATKQSITLAEWDIISYNNRVIYEACPDIREQIPDFKQHCAEVIALRR